jgi:hypothetical protein
MEQPMKSQALRSNQSSNQSLSRRDIMHLVKRPQVKNKKHDLIWEDICNQVKLSESSKDAK